MNATITEARNAISLATAGNSDHTVPVRSLEWRNGYLNSAAGELPMTLHSAAQLAGKAGIPGSVFRWLHKHAPQEFGPVIGREFSAWKEANADKQMFLRTGNDSQGRRRVRAYLSDRYSVVDHADALEGLERLLPQVAPSARVVALHGDAITGDLRMELEVPGLIPANLQDRHFGGFSVTNNELGAGSLELAILLKRLACLNGMVRNVTGASTRTVHLGNRHGLERIEGPLQVSLTAAMEQTPAAFATYYDLRERRLANPAEALRDLAPAVGLGKRALEQIQREERLARYVAEVGPTAYAVVNSVTELARDEKVVSAREVLNKAAEALITLPGKKWEAYQN